MLRRSVIGAALAFPALIATRKAAACSGTPVYEDFYGYDPYACGGTPPPWIGDFNREWYTAINSYNMAVGAVPWKPGTRAISGLNDDWFRAQLTPGEYADLSDLGDIVTVTGAVGSYVGWRFAGSRGVGVGATLGGMGGIIMWLGYNFGVAINRFDGVSSHSAPSYGGYSFTHSTPVGTYTGAGIGGWMAVPMAMSDDLTYKLL